MRHIVYCVRYMVQIIVVTKSWYWRPLTKAFSEREKSILRIALSLQKLLNDSTAEAIEGSRSAPESRSKLLHRLLGDDGSEVAGGVHIAMDTAVVRHPSRPSPAPTSTAICSYRCSLHRPSGDLGAVILMVGRSYVGNDGARSTLLDRACACSYENLPKYRSYRVRNTAP